VVEKGWQKFGVYVSLQQQLVIFVGFIVFEVCVGIFWPALGTMRGKYVPEASELFGAQGWPHILESPGKTF